MEMQPLRSRGRQRSTQQGLCCSTTTDSFNPETYFWPRPFVVVQSPQERRNQCLQGLSSTFEHIEQLVVNWASDFSPVQGDGTNDNEIHNLFREGLNDDEKQLLNDCRIRLRIPHVEPGEIINYLQDTTMITLWEKTMNYAFDDLAQHPNAQKYLALAFDFSSSTKVIPKYLNNLTENGDLKAEVLDTLREKLTVLDRISSALIRKIPTAWHVDPIRIPEQLNLMACTHWLVHCLQRIDNISLSESRGITPDARSSKSQLYPSLESSGVWNPLIVFLTALGLMATCFPTTIALYEGSPRDPRPALRSDPDFMLLIQSSIFSFLALLVTAMTIHDTHLATVARRVAWSLFGLGLVTIIISVILYTQVIIGWSIFLSFLAAAANAMITLQLIFVTEVVARQS